MTDEMRKRVAQIKADNETWKDQGMTDLELDVDFLVGLIDEQAKEIDLFKVYGEKMHRNYEDAEKERDRMRAALESIAAFEGRSSNVEARAAFEECAEIAREALK